MTFNPNFLKRTMIICCATLLWQSAECQKKYAAECLGFEDGLPSLNITGITQDSQGLMWFGAFATGLIRYDGFTFKVFNQSPESKPRLSSNHVRDVILDRKGRLWIAHNKGIDIIQPKTLELLAYIPLAGDDATIKGQACSLCLDTNGDIWVAAYEKGVFRFINGDAAQIEFVAAIPEALYINQTPNGQLFCTSANGRLYYFENGQFVPCQFGVKTKNIQIKPIENQLGLMVGFQMKPPMGVSQPFLFNLKTNRFEPGVAEDGITVLTSEEVRQKMLQTMSPLSKDNLFGHAFRLFMDNQGLLWIAPEYGGVFKLKPININFITCPDLKGVSLRGMIEAPNGKVYIATYNGLFEYFPKTNQAKLPNRVGEDIFFNLAQIRGSAFTALSESKGIGNYDFHHPSVFKQADTRQLSRDLSFFASLPLDNNWILAGNQQIFRYRVTDQKLEPVVKLPTQLSVQTFCFKPARDGRIWVGTTEGVFLITLDGQCEMPEFRQDYRLGQESRINDIYESEDGKIWFATHNYGLLCYDKLTKKIQAFDQFSGFTSNETYKVVGCQADKYIWVSTFSGLQCLETQGSKIYFFNESDGISGNEFNTGSFLQTQNGEFYFGGVRGLTRFDPNRFSPLKRASPTPYITELFIEDVYSNVIDKLDLPTKDTLIQLLHSQNTLEFHLGSNDYFRPKSNNFYVQLLNVDSDWVPMGSLSSIKYYRLNPGLYTFRVKYNLYGDKLSNQIFSISFKIDEIYYKKWWFLFIVFILLFFIIYGFVELKKTRKKREYELRRSIAHDLHNALGGKISSISNMVHVIDRLNQSGKPFQAELGQMLDLTRKAYGTMSDVIWVLTQAKRTNSSLVSRMEDYADKWLKMAHVKVRFETNLANNEIDIPFSVQHELILIYKEILGNILKHTFSEMVEIRFIQNTDKSIELSAQNTFSERKTDVISNGFGIPIMQEHVSRIGGTLQIEATEHNFQVQIRFENPQKAWRRF